MLNKYLLILSQFFFVTNHAVLLNKKLKNNNNGIIYITQKLQKFWGFEGMGFPIIYYMGISLKPYFGVIGHNIPLGKVQQQSQLFSSNYYRLFSHYSFKNNKRLSSIIKPNFSSLTLLHDFTFKFFVKPQKTQKQKLLFTSQFYKWFLFIFPVVKMKTLFI